MEMYQLLKDNQKLKISDWFSKNFLIELKGINNNNVYGLS